MKKKILKIQSQDHTNTLIFIDKIQCVIEKKNGCTIILENGVCVNSTAKIEDIENAIYKALQGGD